MAASYGLLDANDVAPKRSLTTAAYVICALGAGMLLGAVGFGASTPEVVSGAPTALAMTASSLTHSGAIAFARPRPAAPRASMAKLSRSVASQAAAKSALNAVQAPERLR